MDATWLLRVRDPIELQLACEVVRRAVLLSEERDEALAARIINRLAQAM